MPLPSLSHKRLEHSRHLLWLALLLALAGEILPWRVDPYHTGTGEDIFRHHLRLLHHSLLLLASSRWNLSNFIGLVLLLWNLMTLVLLLSSPWLISFHRRARPILWLVRLLALGSAAYGTLEWSFSGAVFLDAGSGLVAHAIACWLLLLGLLAIPPAEPHSS
ncbi:hypothetical protein [Luteolibacter sp. LG18]|uniref:hypothetical protein n=1 Tax=Luteolibacter sp. LG18 TaxID=2819286 RepID=UPI0030C6D732